MKRRLWLGGAAVAALAAGVGVQAWRARTAPAPPPTPPATPQAATGDPWTTTLTRLDGTALPLSTLQGRPLLLNFWATWCAPCVAELPEIDGFMRRPEQAGWRWLAIAVDGNDEVRRFLDRQKLELPVGLGQAEGLELSRRLGNRAATLPFTAVFDGSGGLRDVHRGSVDAKRLESWRNAIS